MKQGSGHSMKGDTKREPISRAINIGGVSEIGNAVFKNPENIHAGRGFAAPSPVAEDHHRSGSQGKHT